jgi:hypothetical protein
VNTSLLIWISPLSFCKRIALTFLSLAHRAGAQGLPQPHPLEKHIH